MLLCMEQRIVKEDHKIAFPHSLNLKMTICLIVNPGKRKREKEHKNETLGRVDGGIAPSAPHRIPDLRLSRIRLFTRLID